ncbi:GFA family protein [Pleomorphomonas sp. PLEO]|uniref:GFA family protein n=1 Tax=Pleomorphomonas sp. PLEO TaxID=3239306 RepID=UPI00351F326E
MDKETARIATTGRCLCGVIRFEIFGEIEAAAYCHCSDCRRCTGSAFGVSIPVLQTNFKLVSGGPKSFTKTADSGNELTRHFCPECGSPLFTSSPRHPDRVYVKAGVLDDPAVVEPAYQSWVSSSVSWANIPPSLRGYEKGRR